MSWIMFFYALTIGWQPMDQTSLDFGYTHYIINVENSIVVNLDCEVKLFDVFYIGGIVETQSNIIGELQTSMFAPFQSKFQFRTGVDFKIANDFFVNVQFDHWCYHPITSQIGNLSYHGKLFGGRDQVAMTISNRSVR
jgi:hypothetical protein